MNDAKKLNNKIQTTKRQRMAIRLERNIFIFSMRKNTNTKRKIQTFKKLSYPLTQQL